MIKNRKFAALAKKFAEMTPDEQKKYLADHPNSKLKAGGTKPATKPDKTKTPKAEKPAKPPAAKKAPAAKAPKPAASKPKQEGFIPKNIWKPERKAPGLLDTINEMFGRKRGTYASVANIAGKRVDLKRLDKFVRAETAAQKTWDSLTASERAAYLKARPDSRFATKA